MTASNNMRKNKALPVLFGISMLKMCISQVYASTISDNTLDMGKTIVTARGYQENSIDTPFVVESIDGYDLEESGQTTVEEALRSQPSVDIHNGGNVAYSMLWMRGTGSLSMTSLDDNSVDFRVDGISNGKTGMARNLVDVEQVQVVKGPQGTLLGSDAEAGSILIKTTDPKSYAEGHVGLGIGNDDLKSAEVVFNRPITDNVAVRVAAMTSSADNQLIRREDNQALNTKKKQGIQAKLSWKEGGNKAVLGVYHDKQTNNVPVLQRKSDSYDVATFGLKHDSENIAQGATLNTTHEIDFASVETTMGYHKYKGEIDRPYLPPEMLPVHYLSLGIPVDQQPLLDKVFAMDKNNGQFMQDKITQVSSEVRLVSKNDSKVKWVTGIYVDNKKRSWYNSAKLDLSELPASAVKMYLTTTPSNGDSYKTFESSSQALFGELSVPVTDSLAVMAGARATHERLKHANSWEGNSNNALAAGGIKAASKTLDETATTGRLGLSFAMTPQWRVYGLKSIGHKFGGFADYETNTVYGNPISTYKPTEIYATEFGTKFESKDNRVKLGLAVYRNIMEDDHITVMGAPPVYKSETANVDSESQGVELSVKWSPINQLSLSTDIAYTDTRVTNADEVPLPTTAMPALTKKGNQMPQVPKITGAIAVRYSDELYSSFLFPDLYWYVGADYRYVGKRFAQSFNVFELEDYGLLGLQAGIGGENHEFSLWGKNITDERYQYIGAQPGNIVTVAPAKTFGLKYKYLF